MPRSRNDQKRVFDCSEESDFDSDFDTDMYSYDGHSSDESPDRETVQLMGALREMTFSNATIVDSGAEPSSPPKHRTVKEIIEADEINDLIREAYALTAHTDKLLTESSSGPSRLSKAEATEGAPDDTDKLIAQAHALASELLNNSVAGASGFPKIEALQDTASDTQQTNHTHSDEISTERNSSVRYQNTPLPGILLPAVANARERQRRRDDFPVAQDFWSVSFTPMINLTFPWWFPGDPIFFEMQRDDGYSLPEPPGKNRM